jgi:hypothetical protein
MRVTSRAVRTAAAIAMTCAAALVPGTALATPTGQPGLGGLGTAVPAGFKANSVTWLPGQRGWVLGAAPCGKNTCSDVIATTDGGATWRLIGTVKAPLASIGKGTPGVTEIRFATPSVGWIFGVGGFLFRTGDGGRSWTAMPVPGGAKQVLDLAASVSQAYAIVSFCTLGKPLCPHQLGFWRIGTGAGSTWARVPLGLPRSDAADVAVAGKTVYVVDPQLEFGRPDKLYASTDGAHFAARTAPCSHAQDIELIQAVPMPAGHVALLCDGNPGFSKAVKSVYLSADTGKTGTFAGQMGLFGIQAQLAASPSGNLAVTSWSDGSFIYVNDTHKTAWTMVEGIGDGGAGWNDIGYVSSTVAWVVYGPADFSGIGQLWVTRDAGQRWAPVKL